MPQSAPDYLDAQGNPLMAPDALDAQGNPLTMNFAVVNGQRVPVEDSPIDLVRGAVSELNPMPALRAVGDIGLGAVKTLNPQTSAQGVREMVQPVKDILGAHKAVIDKGVEEWQKGNYADAGVHFLNAILPVIGPSIDRAVEDVANGKPWRGIGEAIGIGTNLGLPGAVKNIRGVTIPAVARNPNPVEAAAVAFGQAQGIPVDAGTATGNLFVKAAQKGADYTPLGSRVAAAAHQATGEALAQTGTELANAVHPVAVSPEQAGGAVRQGVSGLIQTLHEQANDAYGRLREIEARHETQVPKQESPGALRDIRGHQQATLGQLLTPAELQEVRRIKAEMESVPYTSRTWTEAPRKSGNAAGGAYDIKAGSAGAPVYDDILADMPANSRPTRGQIINSLNSALETGYYTSPAKAAVEVARRRLAKDPNVSGPILPPDAGMPSQTESILMPVDLRPAKTALQPIYLRLKREGELAPLMGGKAEALRALDRLLNGPDLAPVSVADSALSDLKALARGATMPELRTQGQGVAARAVGLLDRQVQQAVEKAGPEAVSALQEGRAATVAKYATADVLDQLRAEPVKGFRDVTAPKDSNIGLLRQVQESAPETMPQIGRAVLDELLTKATAEGGFGRAKSLSADWQRLGPQTKNLIFSEPGAVKALDQFFLLAKKLEDNPNPSGTALTGIGLGAGGLIFTHPMLGIPVTLGAGALSKILRNPKAIQLLTQGTRLSLGPGQLSTTARRMALADFVGALREAGVSTALPAAAQGSDQPEAPALAR